MGRHTVLKEWVNGNEISVSIDDNLNNTFRAEVIVFKTKLNIKAREEFGTSHTVTGMAIMIVEALEYAKKGRGEMTPFDTRVLVGGEGLEEEDIICLTCGVKHSFDMVLRQVRCPKAHPEDYGKEVEE